jgi:hypothetical protein
MPTEKQLTEIIEKIQEDVGGFIAASLVDLESGMTLAAKSTRTATSPSRAPTTASSSNRSSRS